MKPFAVQFGTRGTLLLAAVPLCAWLLAPPVLHAQRGSSFASGSVSGMIVDGEGVPQMGALVQLLMPDTRLVATAITDARGHYRLPSVLPGAYRVQVSAAFFLPSLRKHLVIAENTRAVVNMTLSTVLATTEWLPATRRAAGGADDDWMWTLRASAMRPVLRLAAADEADSSGSAMSSSAERPRGLTTTGRMTVQDSEGGFAQGGTHSVLSMVRRSGDTLAVLRTDISGPRTPFPVSPSADLTVGWERKLPFTGTSRTLLTYTAHPEVQGANGATGLQTAVMRNAQRMELGDSIQIDAGSVTRDVSLGGNSFTVEPFLQVSAHPADGIVIAYTFTKARGTESLEDLDRVHPEVPAAFSRHGHVQLERGTHQSLGIAGKLPHHGVITLAVYRDHIVSASLTGVGLLPAVDAATVASATDATTATFLAAAHDYSASGIRMTVRQPVTDSVTLDGSFSDGQALNATASPDATLLALINGLESRNTLTAAVGATGQFQRTGTTLSAGYRWQPDGSLTAVDRFRAADNTAYLHAKLRQSLRSFTLLPTGFEAVLEVQNLLAQGYQPFLSHDGRTLFLAQSPRVLQAGLSFTF